MYGLLRPGAIESIAHAGFADLRTQLKTRYQHMKTHCRDWSRPDMRRRCLSPAMMRGEIDSR
jgi:hypothetical protein